MMNFIAQSMRRMGIATDNKVTPVSPNSGDQRAANSTKPNAHLDIGSKWSYSTLEYPMDIQSKSDMGHYMMFYVNIANDSAYGRKNTFNKSDENLGAGSLRAKGSKTSPAEKSVMNGQGFSEKQTNSGLNSKGTSWKPGYKPKVIERKAHQGTAADTIGVKRTKRTNDAIVLYMPATIQTNYTADYKDMEHGQLLGGLASMVSKTDASISGLGSALKGAATMATDSLEKAGSALVAAAVPGIGDIKAAADKLDNKAANNFLESTFTGVQFRKFSFQWKFTPKSPEEAENVYKIIRTFKFHMLPEIKGGEFGRWYTTPAEFDIFYMFRGVENAWINKIQTCILRNMDVNYAPNGYQTFRPIEGDKTGAPPTEIDMKLDFQETKLITKADALKGF